MYSYTVSVSRLTVFVTVTRSVVPSVVRVPLLLFRRATSKRINTAAPATHTHGEVYHSDSVTLTVVFVLVFDSVVSCAKQTSCNANTRIETNVSRKAVDHAIVFILMVFGYKIHSIIIQQLRQPGSSGSVTKLIRNSA